MISNMTLLVSTYSKTTITNIENTWRRSPYRLVSKIKKTNKYCFGNQTKFLIFLRNNHDCMFVDPYKARKRYTVAESLDLIVSVKQRNPIEFS
jgi:hypothetical protein